ncbi:hypothetical protein LA080_006042 [Diaporthe eres]|nr:hypothetical protein LA080_006042 [Diaporthe eres]
MCEWNSLSFYPCGHKYTQAAEWCPNYSFYQRRCPPKVVEVIRGHSKECCEFYQALFWEKEMRIQFLTGQGACRAASQRRECQWEHLISRKQLAPYGKAFGDSASSPSATPVIAPAVMDAVDYTQQQQGEELSVRQVEFECQEELQKLQSVAHKASNMVRAFQTNVQVESSASNQGSPDEGVSEGFRKLENVVRELQCAVEKVTCTVKERELAIKERQCEVQDKLLMIQETQHRVQEMQHKAQGMLRKRR